MEEHKGLPVQKLEEWITFAEAAQILGMSKQAFHKLIKDQGVIPLTQIRAIGDKPIYIVRKDVIDSLKVSRDTAKNEKTEMKKFLESLG